MKLFFIDYTYGLFLINGRIGRLRYFLSGLFLVIWSLLIYFIIMISLPHETVSNFLFETIGIYIFITFLGLIIIKIRRLHDLNMSGWWSIGFTLLEFIPLIGLATLYLLFKKGTEGSNKYGEAVV